MSSVKRSHVVAGAIGVLTGVGYRRFQHDVRTASARALAGSALATTRCGPIEYAQVGQGKPLLIIHGAGGGYDQGLLFAGAFAERGFRVTAMSRFGYLRTPMPADASPRAQAEAHACLLDELGIASTVVIGASAGAPSAMQFAIRYPERCTALVLLVPIVWKPSELPDSAPALSPRAQLLLRWMVGSDSVYWLALHLARNSLIKRILATPPRLVQEATASEQARIDEVLHSVLPLSKRAAGLENDARIAGSVEQCELESIRCPTLIVSLRDDRYGTYPGAQYTAQHIPGARFIGYERGGHLWVGHHEELIDQIASFAA